MSIFVPKIGTKKNTTTAYVRDEISRLPWTENNHFHAPAFSRDFFKISLENAEDRDRNKNLGSYRICYKVFRDIKFTW